MWPFNRRPPYTVDQFAAEGDPPEFKHFLDQRFCEAVNVYRRSSDRNGGAYSLCRNAVIILSAVTTVLISAGFKDNPDALRPITLVISFIVTVMSTLMATFNYRDKWITYRATYDDLLHQFHLFRNGVGDYHNADDARRLFVQRVEDGLERANVVASGLQIGASARNGAGEPGEHRPAPEG